MPRSRCSLFLVEEPKLQCACANCGEVIAYARADIGQAIECPKCGEKSELPQPDRVFVNSVEPEPFQPGEGPDAARNRLRICGECRRPIPLGKIDCTVCKLRRLRQKLVVWASLTIAIAVVGGGVWLVVQHKYSDKVKPRGTTAMTGQPGSKAPVPTGELNVTGLALQESRQLSPNIVLLAVGNVRNDSDREHFDLKLDLDLLDAAGTKIDSLSVYQTYLPPRGNWRVSEMVTNSQVKGIRFAGLAEKK